MTDIQSKAEQAAEKEIPYNEKVAITFSEAKHYDEVLKFKRSLFIKGYLAHHNERNKDIVLDERKLEGRVNGKTIKFSNLEILVLSLLLSNRGSIFSNNEISKAGWEGGFLTCDNSIRVVISKIRKKIGSDAIKVIPKRGYILVD